MCGAFLFSLKKKKKRLFVITVCGIDRLIIDFQTMSKPPEQTRQDQSALLKQLQVLYQKGLIHQKSLQAYLEFSSVELWEIYGEILWGNKEILIMEL